MRRVLRLLSNPALKLLICGFLFLAVFRSFAIEPFDFEESLFRRMAEETKTAAHSQTNVTFNGAAFDYASPLFVKSVSLWSSVIDGPAEPMSAFAARSFGFAFVLLIAFALQRTWILIRRRTGNSLLSEATSANFEISPVYFLLMGTFPLMTSSALLPDLIYSFFVTSFLCFELLRIRQRTTFSKNSIYSTAGSAAALAGHSIFFGMSGVVYPLLISIIFVLLADLPARKKFAEWLYFLPQLVIATTVAYLFNQIFGFGTSSGESASAFHAGLSPVYLSELTLDNIAASLTAVIFLLLSGCSLLFVWVFFPVFFAPEEKNFLTSRPIVPERADAASRVWLTAASGVYFLAFLLVGHGRIAGAWTFLPALAFLASAGGFAFQKQTKLKTLAAIRKCLSLIPFILPLCLFLAAAFVVLWEPVLSGFIPLSPKNSALLETWLDDSLMLTAGFSGAALFLLPAAILVNMRCARLAQRGQTGRIFTSGIVRWIVFFHAAACAAIAVFAAPAAENVLTATIRLSAAKARFFRRVGGKIAALSFESPNLVSSNMEPVLFDKGNPETIFSNSDVTVVLTPVWHTGTCVRHGFDIAQAVEYMRVCLRSYRQTLEGRPP
ncbi:MAG: hypothetical protein EBR09_00205 [Proteobacteria bacterium]|nr:hypothetical protein [Pseudomonadota bacterium]